MTMSGLIDNDNSRDDVIIAVMGTTGAGKSTFISGSTKDETIRQGHGLISCTSRVSIHTTKIKDRTVHLLDTPGFDDSNRTDLETLQELAYWLAAAYEHDIKLSGIIYLHRISDTRLQGSALRSLTAFKAMCGEAALGGVVLATTMWDTIPPNDMTKALNRQAELRNRICQDIQTSGGKVVALSAANIDRMKILQHIVERNQRLTLRFQEELVVENKLIYETGAAKVLLGASGNPMNCLQSATHASHEVMAKLVVAGQIQDAEDAEKAVVEMANGIRLFEDDVKAAEVRLTDIRKSWEDTIAEENRALEGAFQTNKERLEELGLYPVRNQSLTPSPSPGEQSICSPAEHNVRPASNTDITTASSSINSCSTGPDSADLMRERQAIMLTMDTRLHRRRTPFNHISPRVGIIGTGLAIGQLVATLACTVM
ncbi:P-loop containing nucleoside triphosphate hydrolase protein [Paraphoma chrysanthemicola]|nr:P-loop containing nucleoside triphosphate hydrolase protein [Paraphoma chrysanthemicola]